MKVTMKAVLINLDEEKINIINNLMAVFCSAVRYSFKRILENQKISDIEKDVAFKYRLNIRQSKDAVENARQTIVRPYEKLYTGHNGMIGIDTNPNGFPITMIDNKGNYKWHTYLKNGELTYAGSDKRQNLCGELVKKVVLMAQTHVTGVAIENLKFQDDKDVNKKFARKKHQFIYRQLLTMLESACKRSGIEIVKVKPQFTSKIGLYKYCHQYGMVVHNGASMVIARRSYKFKEKIPKILKEKTVTDLEKFEKKNEWSKWSEINKSIKRKAGENPALWLIIRKKLLGIA